MIKLALSEVFYTNSNRVLPILDHYLETEYQDENDRAVDVISPSMCDRCSREQVLSRILDVEKAHNPARLQRIFDNGHHVHKRLQKYLMDEGTLICIEIPLRNDKLNLQGHADGFIDLSKSISNFDFKLEELSPYLSKGKNVELPKKYWDNRKFTLYKDIQVAEMKSMNTKQFKDLHSELEKHRYQANSYLYCVEKRRKYLHKTYPTWKSFLASEFDRAHYYKQVYAHMKDGEKFTREQKIAFKVRECLKTDLILYLTLNPVKEVIFIYEDKNDQNIKEFTMEFDEVLMKKMKLKFEEIEKSIRLIRMVTQKKKVPDITSNVLLYVLPKKEGTSRSCNVCKYCGFTNFICWV